MHQIFHGFPLRTIGQRCARATSVLAACLAVWLCIGGAAAQEAYRLSPGDRIALRVVAWDTIELDFVEYGALNGDYTVGPDGRIMVPLLGPVEAAGRSVTELADRVTEDLQGRLGLVEPPSTSIAIVDYRPVYVLGVVRRPGPYAFAPGLTVQQALAIAGGIDPVLSEGPDGLTAAIRAAGSLREIGIDMARQQIRAARLRAEMDLADDLIVPADFSHPDGPEAVAAILSHERSLFQSRRDAQNRALAALDDSRALLETEIAALEEKRAGQARQVALLQEQVGNVESLVERGIARSPNLVALQSQLIDLENRELDTETATFRARQAIAELERDRVDIEASRRLEVLRELQQTEAELELLAARRATFRQLLSGAEALLAQAGEDQAIRPVFEITREDADGRRVLNAGPETRLAPADVLEVGVLAEEDG